MVYCGSESSRTCQTLAIGIQKVTNTLGWKLKSPKSRFAELGVDIEFAPVTAQTRGALLDNGQLDMVIAAFTILEERINFTTPYYTDAVGFLVRKDSNI